MVALWMCWWLTKWLRDGEVSLGFGGKRRIWWWVWYYSCNDAVFFLVGAEFVC